MPKTYSRAHRTFRSVLEPQVASGTVVCARCGRLIAAGEPWDLGHVDGTGLYAGPEHRRCNRATQEHGRMTARPRGRRRVSRQW